VLEEMRDRIVVMGGPLLSAIRAELADVMASASDAGLDFRHCRVFYPTKLPLPIAPSWGFAEEFSTEEKDRVDGGPSPEGEGPPFGDSHS
jgi:hypothetical protein